MSDGGGSSNERCVQVDMSLKAGSTVGSATLILETDQLQYIMNGYVPEAEGSGRLSLSMKESRPYADTGFSRGVFLPVFVLGE